MSYLFRYSDSLSHLFDSLLLLLLFLRKNETSDKRVVSPRTAAIYLCFLLCGDCGGNLCSDVVNRRNGGACWSRCSSSSSSGGRMRSGSSSRRRRKRNGSRNNRLRLSMFLLLLFLLLIYTKKKEKNKSEALRRLLLVCLYPFGWLIDCCLDDRAPYPSPFDLCDDRGHPSPSDRGRLCCSDCCDGADRLCRRIDDDRCYDRCCDASALSPSRR